MKRSPKAGAAKTQETESVARRVENILELIGETPLLRLQRLPSEGSAEVWLKLESLNPGGSLKDRAALAMVEAAEAAGVLQPGDTIVEPTSGNMGIGLAQVAAVKGYRCVLVMPERRGSAHLALLQHFGARVVLTPARLRMEGAIARAKSIIAENPRCFMPQQFTNEANRAAHRAGTGAEILSALGGAVDGFVAAVGTSGSLSGVGAALREANPATRLVAVEPASSAVLSGEASGAHGIPGIGAGFMPPLFDPSLVDQIYRCAEEDALRCSRALARNEGLSAGLSAGAAVWGALRLAAELRPTQRVVTLLCDRWGESPWGDERALPAGLDFII